MCEGGGAKGAGGNNRADALLLFRGAHERQVFGDAEANESLAPSNWSIF